MLDQADNEYIKEEGKTMTIDTKEGIGNELSEWREKREMHSKMMDVAINAGDVETVKFHSTRIMQCDRMIAFLERN